MTYRKLFRWISNLVSITLFLTLILMVFIVISSKASGGEPNFLGYQIKTVLSGSMDPTFKTGSLIAVNPIEDRGILKKGDVITYKQDEQSLVTHRILEVIENGDNTLYKTKGDNNEEPDMNLVLSENVIGKYTGFTIPFLGYFVNFAKSQAGTATLLIIPGLLLLIYSGVTIWRELKELERASASSNAEKII